MTFFILNINDECFFTAGDSNLNEQMCYLMSLSTHFILLLYDVRHMVKNHSDSERGNPLLPQRLLFLISN